MSFSPGGPRVFTWEDTWRHVETREDTWSCASAHLSVKVLRSRMSKVTAHAAIRVDGRVCVADVSLISKCRGSWCAFTTVWWVKMPGKAPLPLCPSLSIKLSSALTISHHVFFCSPSQSLHNRCIQLRHKPRSCRAGLLLFSSLLKGTL